MSGPWIVAVLVASIWPVFGSRSSEVRAPRESMTAADDKTWYLPAGTVGVGVLDAEQRAEDGAGVIPLS